MRHSRAVVELLDRNDEVIDARPMGTVGPLATVPDTVYFVVKADSAALGDAGLRDKQSVTGPSPTGRHDVSMYAPRLSSRRCCGAISCRMRRHPGLRIH